MNVAHSSTCLLGVLFAVFMAEGKEEVVRCLLNSDCDDGMFCDKTGCNSGQSGCFVCKPVPSGETCKKDSNCIYSKHCFNKECVDVCAPHSCGINAKCHPVKHKTYCYCDEGYTGKPTQHCYSTYTKKGDPFDESSDEIVYVEAATAKVPHLTPTIRPSKVESYLLPSGDYAECVTVQNLSPNSLEVMVHHIYRIAGVKYEREQTETIPAATSVTYTRKVVKVKNVKALLPVHHVQITSVEPNVFYYVKVDHTHECIPVYISHDALGYSISQMETPAEESLAEGEAESEPTYAPPVAEPTYAPVKAVTKAPKGLGVPAEVAKTVVAVNPCDAVECIKEKPVCVIQDGAAVCVDPCATVVCVKDRPVCVVEGRDAICRDPCDGKWCPGDKPVCEVVDKQPVCTEAEDCYYDEAKSYDGKTAVTVSGRTCQSWSSDVPHMRTSTAKAKVNFPDETVAAADNFCRSPDNDVTPWCYTMDKDKEWEYCDVKECEKKTLVYPIVTTDPCEQNPCGENAECTSVEHKAVCTCPEGYTGDAKISCDKLHPCVEAVCSSDTPVCVVQAGLPVCVNLCDMVQCIKAKPMCVVENKAAMCIDPCERIKCPTDKPVCKLVGAKPVCGPGSVIKTVLKEDEALAEGEAESEAEPTYAPPVAETTYAPVKAVTKAPKVAPPASSYKCFSECNWGKAFEIVRDNGIGSYKALEEFLCVNISKQLYTGGRDDLYEGCRGCTQCNCCQKIKTPTQQVQPLPLMLPKGFYAGCVTIYNASPDPLPVMVHYKCKIRNTEYYNKQTVQPGKTEIYNEHIVAIGDYRYLIPAHHIQLISPEIKFLIMSDHPYTGMCFQAEVIQVQMETGKQYFIREH